MSGGGREEEKGQYDVLSSEGKDETNERSMLARVWSSLLIVKVAALGIFESSSTMTLL
jgi:hypothetical protein